MNNKTPHILLVEDNTDDVELIRLGLSKQIIPYNLTIAVDGKEAMKILKDTSSPLPDLVLLDLYLPQVN
jgi:CheY-like chemotaxis protein